MRSVSAAMLTTAARALSGYGVTWPVDLGVAVARYYVKELGESSASAPSSTAASALSTSATTRTAVADE